MRGFHFFLMAVCVVIGLGVGMLWHAAASLWRKLFYSVVERFHP